jgi:hypothetical protein
LTQLQWEDVIIYNTNWTKRTAKEQVLSALWQQLQLLPKLSSVWLGGRLTSADVTPLSSLQHLQRLGVSLFSNSAAAAVAAAAPPGLTALDLDLGSTLMGFGDHSAPSEVCLSALSQLQCFRGAGVRMQPSTLAAKTGLQELHLHWPKTSDRLHWISRELLSALQPLTQLRHLELKECWLNRMEPPPEQQGDGYKCFSALTASTQLTALILEESAAPPVPQAAFDHLFPPGHVLPHLQVLSLMSCCYRPCMYVGYRPCVEAVQVAMIAARCPALQELTLKGVTPQGLDVNCLKQLPLGVQNVEGLGWSRS